MNTAFKGFFLPMRTSLQARVVSVVVIAFFAIAVLLSVGSMLLVRSSVLDQVSQESQRDFSNQLVEAKKVINSADSTDLVQYQQLANDVASMLQQDASPSLVGVCTYGVVTPLDVKLFQFLLSHLTCRLFRKTCMLV